MQSFANTAQASAARRDLEPARCVRWAHVVQLRSAAHAELLRFLGARLPGGDADDVAQECYLRLQRCENLLALRDPKAFLFRVAGNLLTDRARQRARRQRDLQRLGAVVHFEDAADVAAGDTALDDVLVAEEALHLIAAALERLPAKCRRALVMQRLEGLSHEEIAMTLCVSKSMVEKYIARAVGVLRAVLP
ncbi:MAG TPA: sigma-70 family RNA polymerase sigma factor [Steroidobacteraceae bacterium]|nr:sigma-70 family RNA polymerase sigma factor [Steroidobacteraceae bacterium]